MSDYTRRNEADELREQLNNRLDYIAVLEAKCRDVTEKLREMNLAVEHNRQVANEEQLKREIRYRDGVIAGLKYAIRCNGVSGVHVIRCKDCKWFRKIGCVVNIVDESDEPKENDYCSWAERKEE